MTSAARSGGPGAYALPPPKQCDNQFFVQGCQNGMANTTCGGVCSAANACEDISQKPNADVGFLCPRFGLQSAEMLQAATDDFGPSPAFDYAIVGHDVDQNAASTAPPPARLLPVLPVDLRPPRERSPRCRAAARLPPSPSRAR